MVRLSDEQVQQIKRFLDKERELPIEWRSIIFPTEKQEYELVYADKRREEDIIADTMAVPLQAVRAFNNDFDGWHNRLIFGDNLQAMKSMLDDSNIAGKVKLVYIVE